MEEQSVGEVLYEERSHASGPYSSNYPPLPSQSNDGGNGSFLSLLSVRGISRLREKWSSHSSRDKFKKPVSLFISSMGERVAVATGSQITILQKDDDYQEPTGLFNTSFSQFLFFQSSDLYRCRPTLSRLILGTSGASCCAYTCGIWSEGILGVVDDMDTLYFIKASGVQIARITKRQLKISSSIIGLIPQDSSDVPGSCLCRFLAITSDGYIHQIDVSRESSINSVSNSRSAAKGQFPKDVFCFHYVPESSLLLVVGSMSVGSLTSNAGCYHLSIWRQCQNLNLEQLSSVRFEGLYHTLQDNIRCLAYPKVLMSPEGEFISSLDVTGSLHVFRVDKDSSSLSNFGNLERSSSSATSNLEQNGCLNNIVDFTWWSNHIMAVVKRGGIIMMLDILTGSKVKEHDFAYSMPTVDRAQQVMGLIFLLESKSSDNKEIHSKHNDLSDLQDLKEKTEVISDTSRMNWRLMSLSKRSVHEMYRIFIGNREYQSALGFANRYRLDSDEVFKSQWLQSSKGKKDINMFLRKIKDLSFVLSECCERTGPTEDDVKALLAHGIGASDKFRFSEAENYDSPMWTFRMARLQLLQFRDRLETYLGINMGRFSEQEYCKFRVTPLEEVAVTLAESGKIGALNLLFKRHPCSLSPFMLQVLAAIPETIPVQTYGQLLPGKFPPASVALRKEDWVESENMVLFINRLSEAHEVDIQIRTEPIVMLCKGHQWPSTTEICLWYENRAMDIDRYTGQLENCLCLLDFACRKGISELLHLHQDINYLYQLIYSDEGDSDICFDMNLVTWKQLSDYEKFKMMLRDVNVENVVKRLKDKGIPFMLNQTTDLCSATKDPVTNHQYAIHHENKSFLVSWLKEMALENKLDICLKVIEEGCKDLRCNGFFKDEIEAMDCALQCIYLCTVTDRWSTMGAILSKLPQKQDVRAPGDILEKKLKLAEGHIEAGRLLSFYQVPKPMNFFLEAHIDEKGAKQIIRLILSKFVRRQPSRSDNDWANMWRDMLSLQDKAFRFLDLEYMLMEFCKGLLKAGKFSLARNYLKGTGSVSLAPEKAEYLVIQAAREYFFSASSLTSPEIWKAKECLNLFPSSRNVQAEADIIDALTVKLPNLGMTLLPMQFRQIKDPMDIIKMTISSQPGAYTHVDELIEVAKFLGLNSPDDISAVQEAIAREAAVADDLQLAFDLCLILSNKGHGPIWDLCTAIARGPAHEDMDICSRKQLIGFALSHCDEESIMELLHAWKDLDMQGQCEVLCNLSGTNSFGVSGHGSSYRRPPFQESLENFEFKGFSEVSEMSSGDQESHLRNTRNTLLLVAKHCLAEEAADLESFLKNNGRLFSFTTSQLPWLLELSRNAEYCKNRTSGYATGKEFMSIRTQALVTILSWLARNDFSPRDSVIASMAKSVIEPPVTEEEDVMGCSLLLNLVDAFSGVEIIEEQLQLRENYNEICSIMNVGMTYSSLHTFGVECNDPAQRRELLRRKFNEKHAPLSSDEMSKMDKVQSTFWRDWKLKLEEKKRVAEHSRVLEQVIPGVDTARFLSGDLNYIRNAVFSLIESVRLEKKHVIKDVLKLADTYGVDHIEVLQCYLSCILTSEAWTNDDIMIQISECKGEIISSASETIKTVSSVVYPAIDGHNKQRLSIIYALLSDCYLHLEQTRGSSPFSPRLSSSQMAQFYKLVGEECLRVSFIKNLDFKNIAGLGGLNLQCFRDEVFSHINEFSLEPLAMMVKALVGIHSKPVPEGMIEYQDVYKHYVHSLFTDLESRAKTEFTVRNAEKFQEFIGQLERTYDFCGKFIGHLVTSDAMDVLKRCLTIILLLPGAYESIHDDSMWQDSLIFLLNFWFRLTEEMHKLISSESSVRKMSFDPVCLSNCVRIFVTLVREDNVSPSQAWGTIVSYVNHGLIGDCAVEAAAFCRAMVFSGCSFGAVSELYAEMISQNADSPAAETRNLAHLYASMLDPILSDLVNGTLERKDLYHLLSSLGKMEGKVEDLQQVRHVVWERMAQFCDDLQLPNNIRVYALEIMQFISGGNTMGFSSELQSNVLPWEGWHELLTSSKNESTGNLGLPERPDNSSRLTSTLVALKSSQIVSAISPGMEISPDDLSDTGTATSCFLRLCEVSSTVHHAEVLQAVLEEWERLFASVSEPVDTSEDAEVGNNWSNDDWDEGWESFQEIDAMPKEKPKVVVGPNLHPLHTCWIELFRKLIKLSHVDKVMGLIDQSLSKSNGTLIDENEARSLGESIREVDSFIAMKLVLLLPYEALWFQCLDIVEDKLKQGGIPDTISRDHELLTLVLSSGVVSSIFTKHSYGSIFSYLCYLVGSFSRECQEAQLCRMKQMISNEDTSRNDIDLSFLFVRVMFPSFIAELVKANQNVLAGFLVTKFMHTNELLSVINVAEASLRSYLEAQHRALQKEGFAPEDVSSCGTLKNTTCRLRDKLVELIPSVISSGLR
ncbi:MAG2-interacting protein 2 [Linum perenne]